MIVDDCLRDRQAGNWHPVYKNATSAIADGFCQAVLCISAAYAIMWWLAWSLVMFVYYVKMAEDTTALAVECEYEAVPKLRNDTIFNDLELLIQISKSHQCSMLTVSVNVKDRHI